MDVAALSAAQTAATGAASRLAANFDTFLTLLTTQLRNQDPLEPLDTEKFTEQLVQFAAVEQSIQTNTHLEALIALQAASERGSALDLVGRVATIETDKAAHNGDGAAWTYELPEAANAVALAIIDARGTRVALLEGANGEGAHEVRWNGKLADDRTAPEGVYRLIVTAVGADGAPIDATVSTTMRIDAVSFASGETKLETAAGLLDLAAVLRVAAQS